MTIPPIDCTVISQAIQDTQAVPGKLRLAAIVKKIKLKSGTHKDVEDYKIEKILAQQLSELEGAQKTVLTQAFEDWTGLKDASHATRMAVAVASKELKLPTRTHLPEFLTKVSEGFRTMRIALRGGSEKSLEKLNKVERDVCELLTTMHKLAATSLQNSTLKDVARYVHLQTKDPELKPIKEALLELENSIDQFASKKARTALEPADRGALLEGVSTLFDQLDEKKIERKPDRSQVLTSVKDLREKAEGLLRLHGPFLPEVSCKAILALIEKLREFEELPPQTELVWESASFTTIFEDLAKTQLNPTVASSTATASSPDASTASIDSNVISKAIDATKNVPENLRLAAIVKEIKLKPGKHENVEDYKIEKILAQQLSALAGAQKTVLTQAFEDWTGLRNASHATRMAVAAASKELGLTTHTHLPEFLTKISEGFRTMRIALRGGSEKSLEKLNKVESYVLDTLEKLREPAETKEKNQWDLTPKALIDYIKFQSADPELKPIEEALLKLTENVETLSEEVKTAQQSVQWQGLMEGISQLGSDLAGDVNVTEAHREEFLEHVGALRKLAEEQLQLHGNLLPKDSYRPILQLVSELKQIEKQVEDKKLKGLPLGTLGWNREIRTQIFKDLEKMRDKVPSPQATKPPESPPRS